MKNIVLKKSGKLIVAFIILLSCNKIYAQEPAWKWAKSYGNDLNMGCRNSVVDNQGNIYTVGGYSSSNITFGQFVLSNTPGSYSSYVIKQNNLGEVLWAKSYAESIYSTTGFSKIRLDSEGNLIIIGTYKTEIILDAITLLQSSSSTNIMVFKMDNQGNVLWAKSSMNTNLSNANFSAQNLILDENNNIYLTGKFQGTNFNFGDLSVSTTNSTNSLQELFLAKLDSEGNAQWIKTIEGDNTEYISSLLIDLDGNVYCSGYYYSSMLNIDSETLINTISDHTRPDLFIAKYNQAGDFIWAKTAGTIDDDKITGLSIDQNGNLFGIGSFSEETLDLNGTSLIGNGSCANSFIFRFDADFNIIWAKSWGFVDGWGYNPNNTGLAVCSDNFGSTYLLGNFAQNFNFENQVFSNTGLSADLYLAKMDSNGNLINKLQISGADNEFGSEIVVDNNQNLYISGTFKSPVLSFGEIDITNHYPDVYDLFVAKLAFQETNSLDEKIEENLVSVYPNPNKGSFEIQNPTKQELNFELKNALGQVVYQEKLFGEKQKIEINLEKGIYFATFNNEKDSFEEKVIVH